MSLLAEDVLSWAAQWIYVPPDSPTVDTPEYLLVAHPLTWADPTGAFRIASERPPAELVDEVLAAADDLHRDAVTFWIHDDTRPDGLADELQARGAVLAEELAVLARPLAQVPDLDVPDDVEVRVSTDLATERDMDHVGVTVFGGSTVRDVDLEALLTRRDPAVAQSMVAYRDGTPVGAAGISFTAEVARLWGGSVIEEARGSGVYRALLARRLEEGRARGCRAALVTGRLTTSAPVLRRAGFVQYGEQRGYRLAVR